MRNATGAKDHTITLPRARAERVAPTMFGGLLRGTVRSGRNAWSSGQRAPMVAEQATANPEFLRHLEAELRALDTWRAAVVLVDVEGLAPREAAVVLSVEEGDLRVLLHRGRTRLRRSLAPLLGTPA
jgi:DNA-directed RNA polymerase specialized sigma24 family protein